MRSVQYFVAGSGFWAELRRRLDERAATQLLQGEIDDVKALLDGWIINPPFVDWGMWLVQPGVSDAALDGAPQVSSLLTAAHDWVTIFGSLGGSAGTPTEQERADCAQHDRSCALG
jgi:hypothetical protein